MSLASARAAASTLGRKLAEELFPGELSFPGTDIIIPCSLGARSFYESNREGGGGRISFQRLNVTVRAENIPDGATFASGQFVVVKSLVTGEAVRLEIASGNDVIGRDENVQHSDGSITLTLVAPQQG